MSKDRIEIPGTTESRLGQSGPTPARSGPRGIGFWTNFFGRLSIPLIGAPLLIACTGRRLAWAEIATLVLGVGFALRYMYLRVRRRG